MFRITWSTLIIFTLEWQMCKDKRALISKQNRYCTKKKAKELNAQSV